MKALMYFVSTSHQKSVITYEAIAPIATAKSCSMVIGIEKEKKMQAGVYVCNIKAKIINIRSI